MRRRQGPHSHPCAGCGAQTPCDGPLADNYDGEPWVICEDYHLPSGQTAADFLCDACTMRMEDEQAAVAQRYV
jgi:hypothetical protein